MKKIYDNYCGIDMPKNSWLPASSMAKTVSERVKCNYKGASRTCRMADPR